MSSNKNDDDDDGGSEGDEGGRRFDATLASDAHECARAWRSS